jgi:hypothetical protein
MAYVPSKFIHPVFADISADVHVWDCRYGYLVLFFFLVCVIVLIPLGGIRLDRRRSDPLGWILLFLAALCALLALFGGLFGFLPWDWHIPEEEQRKYGANPAHYMANVLPIEKQVAIIGNLCEGSSIRAIERMTGVHRAAALDADTTNATWYEDYRTSEAALLMARIEELERQLAEARA